MIEHPYDGASQLSLGVNVSSPLPQKIETVLLYWFATSPVEHIELWKNVFNREPRLIRQHAKCSPVRSNLRQRAFVCLRKYGARLRNMELD
jgi:hypothetical protein